MKLKNKFAAALLLLSTTGLAFGQTALLTTVSDFTDGGPCIGNSGLGPANPAVVVATPAGGSIQVGSFKARIHSVEADTPISFQLHISNSGIPGDFVGTLGSITTLGSDTYELYTMTLASPIPLAPETEYMIVASSEIQNSCAAGWSYADTAPTGVISYIGTRHLYEGSWIDREDNVQLELQGVAAPRPVVTAVPTLGEWSLVLLGLAAAGAGARQLRRRS